MQNQPGHPPESLDFEHSKKRSGFSQVKSLVTTNIQSRNVHFYIAVGINSCVIFSSLLTDFLHTPLSLFYQ